VNKPKILFASNATRVSGAEKVLERLLDKESRFKSVLFIPRGDFMTILSCKNFKIIISRGMKELKRKKNKLWILEFFFRYIQVFIEFLNVIVKENPDIIYANNYTAAVYTCLPAKIAKIPFIWHMHQTSDPYGFFDKIIQYMLAKYSDLIIAVSNYVKFDLMKLGIKSEKIRVVYNGIDKQVEFNPLNYSKGMFRKKIFIDSNKILIGMISTIMEEKGVHLFIEAINRIIKTNKISNHKTKFLIVGPVWEEDIPYKNKLDEMLLKYDLKNDVLFIGPSNNIPQVMNDIDILVHSGIKSESFGMVIAEAMAMGKIVLAPSVGAINEIIKDKRNGFLFKVGDEVDLSEKIEFLIKYC